MNCSEARMRSTNDATSSGCSTNAARTTSAITGWSASRSARMTTPSATAYGCDDLGDGVEDDVRPVAHDVVAAALGEDGSPVRRAGDEVAMSPADRLDLLGRLDPRALGDDVDDRHRGRELDLPEPRDRCRVRLDDRNHHLCELRRRLLERRELRSVRRKQALELSVVEEAGEVGADEDDAANARVRRGNDRRDDPAVGVSHEHHRSGYAVPVELQPQCVRFAVDPIRRWARWAPTEPGAVVNHCPNRVTVADFGLQLGPDRRVLASSGLEDHGWRARAANR